MAVALIVTGLVIAIPSGLLGLKMFFAEGEITTTSQKKLAVVALIFALGSSLTKMGWDMFIHN
jgi:hypothetical protein